MDIEDDNENCIYNEETGECIPESDIIASLREGEWQELRQEEEYSLKLAPGAEKHPMWNVSPWTDKDINTSYSYLNKPFWLSIRKAKNCLFSRRLGIRGKVIFGYSICLRLFDKEII